MGKGTDKLYITHSEWGSEDAYSASAGSGLSKSKAADTTFKRLPFNFCAVSLLPFTNPVCTADGTIFDIDNITSWLETHNTDPVSGKVLKLDELIRLKFAKNDEDDMVDPVTYKVFTNNTHLVALRNTGNVFSYDTIERLNIKAKMWQDLVSDEPFSRKDIITLQDPQNLDSRNLSSFKYVQEGISTLTPEQAQERNAKVNRSALGNAASVLKPLPQPSSSSTPQIGKYLPSTSTTQQPPSSRSRPTTTQPKHPTTPSTKPAHHPAQTSHHTTGQTAASFTSTGLTPSTTSALALLTDEEYLLTHPRLLPGPAYTRLRIPPHGTLTLSLDAVHAPRAVWNFLTLAKRGYYADCTFHRNIKHFMLQGGDPTGTGRGGESCWGKGKPFKDEFDGGGGGGGPPRSHDRRGVVSMANKGKDTNTSQFFITYGACRHLDRKHTIFGQVVEDEAGKVLNALERVEVSEPEKRPVVPVVMTEVEVLVDPFEEFLSQRARAAAEEEEGAKKGEKEGEKEDDRVTWTGKRVRGAEEEEDTSSVGKYLNAGAGGAGGKGEVVEEWEVAADEPVKKKVKGGGGFGNFDSW